MTENQSEIKSTGKQEVTIEENPAESNQQSSKRLLENNNLDSNLTPSNVALPLDDDQPLQPQLSVKSIAPVEEAASVA